MSRFIDALQEATCAVGIRLTPQQMQRMESYAALLLKANEKTNLTAITDWEAMAQLHFADSLLLPPGVDMCGTCIDVGTGAGFPGVVLSLAWDALEVTLLDSLRKRTDFLCEAKAAMGLGVQIHTARAETAGQDAIFREKFDIAVSRAVAPLNVLAELMLPLVRPGGKAIAWKGPRAAEETKQAEDAIEILGAKAEIVPASLPWGERALVVMHKVNETPPQYPRRPGMPEKRPLGKSAK